MSAGIIVGVAFVSLAAYVARHGWRLASGRNGRVRADRQRPLRDPAHAKPLKRA